MCLIDKTDILVPGVSPVNAGVAPECFRTVFRFGSVNNTRVVWSEHGSFVFRPKANGPPVDRGGTFGITFVRFRVGPRVQPKVIVLQIALQFGQRQFGEH